MTPEAREEVRAKLVRAIPRWYSPWFHFLFPSAVGLGLIAGSALLLRDLRPLELLTIPAVFLLSNAAEWHIHRGVLHRRRRFLEVLYDRHTPLHHRVYVTEDMAMRSRREFRLVLIPAYGIVLAFLALVPVVAALWLLGLPNVGLLFLATSMGYVVSYEWLHLAYHHPPESWVGRLPFMATLRRLHATHHAPEHMQRWNFNVTFPIWDLVRGTYWRPGR